MHTYAQNGTYPIHIVITKSSPTALAALLPIVPAIESTAVVTTPISLVGTITGTYTTPFAVPDVGRNYHFQGSGTAGALGNVTATGSVTLPGFIASGRATGKLTLTNSQGSVTLLLAGPVEPGFGAFPSTLSYAIASGTGAYAGDTASGTIAATLTPASTAGGTNQFTFVLT
jgi:hypothetical protein